jgi:hypothetical protein
MAPFPRDSSRLLMACALGLMIAGPAQAGQLITNGGFETGDFTGWTLANQLGSIGYDPLVPVAGTFAIQGNSGTTPLSGLSALGPASGSFYALADMTAPGAHVLIQSFTVPIGAVSVTLSFDMYNYDWSGVGPVGSSFDWTGDPSTDPNQHVRVDLLTAGASAFDTGAGLIMNFYDSVDLITATPDYTSYMFDLTALVMPGATYQLRFGESDNQFVLNVGVDNVSIVSSDVGVPEPASWLLLLSAGAPLVLILAWRRCRAAIRAV